MSALCAPAPVGVYDSGLGGLSVLPAIRRLMPGQDLVYVADSGHLPYGEKPAQAVVERARRIAEYFMGQGARAVAVACNTATAAAIGELRRLHPHCAFVGIEPAVKPAARLTRSGVIGVLATSGTLLSGKFRELVAREAPAAEVLVRPCPGWVELVERGAGIDEAMPAVAAPVSDLLARGADVLVLGCTHFPFLLPAIRRCVGNDFPVLETSVPFAQELRRQLLARGAPAGGQAGVAGSLRILTSGAPADLAPRVAMLLGEAHAVGRLPERYC
ncbi:glutamate racemase [Pigmentiphaga soli]|uniref:Glutamate racemase n=1 Tax=Pigmentiphaga soli TaxID=1007095 RepID=A0ABP8HNB4_9BURK